MWSELGSLMHRQAVRRGLEVITAEVTGLTQGQSYSVATTEGNIQAESIIIATGSEYRKLGVIGEERLLGHGVSYCAICDGFLFDDRQVAVVGGGDSAITDALELAQHCRKVYIIHRRDQLQAGKVLQERAFTHPKLEFIWDTVVEEVLGEKMLSRLKLCNVKTGQQSVLKVDGVFVTVGLMPNSQVFPQLVTLDEGGFIVTDETMATSAPGIFAAAVGDGVTAAMSAFKYLQETRKWS